MQSSFRTLVRDLDSEREKRCGVFSCEALSAWRWNSPEHQALEMLPGTNTDLFPSWFALSSSHKQECLTNRNHFCIYMQPAAKGTFKEPRSLYLDLELNVFNIFLFSWVGTSDFFSPLFFFSLSVVFFLPLLI